MFLRKDNQGCPDEDQSATRVPMLCCRFSWLFPQGTDDVCCPIRSPDSSKPHPEEDVGLLVPLGFDITAFTPAAYRRGSLPRPSKDDSS